MTNEEALKIAKSTNPLLIGSVNGEEKIQYVERIIYALENIDRITAERDAAIADLRKLSVRPSYIQCDCCLHFQKADGIKRCLKKPDFSGKCWEWRGMKRMTKEMKAELVRCIDCKHAQDAYIKSAKNVSETEKYCIILEDRVKNSHFCSYGERKEE